MFLNIIKKIKLILFIIFLNIFLNLNQSFADTTTVSYVGTVNDIGGGNFPWTNISNLIGNNTNTSASSSISNRNDYTNYISLTNFSLSGAGLLENSTINGIQVDIEWDVTNNRLRDTTVQLTSNGINPIGNNYAINGNSPTSKTVSTYGGLTDTWGTSLTTSDLLSENFGVILQYQYTRNRSTASINLYRVSITIDYTPSITPPPSEPSDIIDFETSGGYTVTSGTWTRTTNNPYEGTYSIESGNHTDNTSSCFEITKNLSSNSNLSFYKYLSSEANYDFLQFYIDGNLENQWSGEISWSKESYSINSGNHTFTWCYEKDYSVSSGQDTAWIDYITFSSPNLPGGIGGVSFWLKADSGTSTQTDGSTLNTWGDQSGNGYNANAGVAPIYRYNDTENINFNPYIDFNGTSQYMQNLDNGANSTSYYAVLIPDNQVDGTLQDQVPFGLDCDSGVLSSGTCGLTFAGLALGAFTVAINDEIITHAIGSSTNWRSAQIGAYTYEANKAMLIGINENINGDGTDIFEKGNQVNNYTVNSYQTLTNADYSLGRSTDAGYYSYYDGKIAEIINYSSRLSDIERQKIESYLALKYGISLNNGNSDYISSSGTTIWSNSLALDYTNNVFGIGRDDSSSLSQIKSKSNQSDGIITIEAIGEGSNINPNFIDIDNLEFLTISNNALGNFWTNIDSPSGYNILERKFLAQEVGEIGNINISFDVENTNFNIPNLTNGTNYYFIYDSNANNSLADETPISMTNTSGNTWSINGINIGNLTKFTIASEASTNNIPTDINISSNNINENSNAGTIIGSFNTNDLDLSDSHLYSLVSGIGADDNISFYIIGNVLYLDESPDYELKNTYKIRVQTDDQNGGTFQKEFIIYVNNLSETTDSIIDFEDISDEYKYNVTSGIWSRNTNNPFEGTYSIESNNGGIANTQSCFEIINTFHDIGTISFNYNVSSQANGDYLRFYIDNIEQQAWSGTIPWTSYIQNDISSGTHSYKWCYIKDGTTNTGSDKAWIDYITFNSVSVDLDSPIINSINYASGTLLAGGNHNLIINYIDSDSGINTSSDNILLYKWNGTNWGSDISTTGFDLINKTITETQANIPTNNLSFGKYLFSFQISDNNGNSSSISIIFYIDEPELIISNESLDIGILENLTTKFSSGEILIQVKTVGTKFDLILNKENNLSIGTIEISDFNGTNGFGYESSPYTNTINLINTNEIIASQAKNINTNGDKNIYYYYIKLGANISEEQAAGNYIGNIKFGLNLDY